MAQRGKWRWVREGGDIRRWSSTPEIGEAPLPWFGGLSGGLHNKGGCPPLARSTVPEVEAEIKRLVTAYERWAREGDIGAHRPCPADGCGCPFRHRHGWMKRHVSCGDWAVRVDLLRLLCPKCGVAETLLPEWLRPHSPYPWPWQEAAALEYVGGLAGYRPVAARFGVDYTVLWGWVHSLAAVAVELVGVVARELLRHEPDTALRLEPVAHGALVLKARTAEKRRGLAHLPLLVRGAAALRAACWRRLQRAADDDGEPGGALGWLCGYLEIHGIGLPGWPRSHRGSHSRSAEQYSDLPRPNAPYWLGPDAVKPCFRRATVGFGSALTRALTKRTSSRPQEQRSVEQQQTLRPQVLPFVD